MNRPHWTWYLALGIFYLGMLAQVGWYEWLGSDIWTYQVDKDVPGLFEGNDWVTWTDTDEGVVASRVHPLPSYKPLDKQQVQVGDRLLELDYQDIGSAEVVDRITRAARPGHTFIAKIERPNPYNQVIEDVNAAMQNGHRLTFSFNEIGGYWTLSGWIAGIGTVLGLIVLAILLPLVRGNFRSYLPLLVIVLTAFSFFALQLAHHLYLIIESNLQNVLVERAYMLAYLLLFLGYGIAFVAYKSGATRRWVVFPSVLIAIYLIVRFYQIAFIEDQLKHFHDLIEQQATAFFLWQIAGALTLFTIEHRPQQDRRDLLISSGIISALFVGTAYFLLPTPDALMQHEHVWFMVSLLFFFPLMNASFLQLQFGKVSLVVTQTFQYLVTLILAIVLYLLIAQLFDYIQLNIQYRRILEFITFLLLMATLRILYLTNENRFTRYFVSTQRERLNQFQAFIKRISQYTNDNSLQSDLKQEIKQYFNTEEPHLWWRKPNQEDDAMEDDIPMDELYQHLSTRQGVWSRTKEISPLTLPKDLEDPLAESPYTLVAPITVNSDQYALLMLRRKRRGVYNLSDLELISQLVQQTQLTINVMRRVEREKELIQQYYEANLMALRSQINPHFLFNTLNSITELVHESADRAEQAVEKLAFILRFTTKKSNEQFLPLQEEMSLIRTYLELEQIRFGERLSVEIDMTPASKEVMVPSFILQTLVENCVKHGISKILHPGIVTVKTRTEGDFLVCDVYDNGPGIDITKIYRSTGLSNSISRLEKLYEMKDLLDFKNTGDGTLVRMRIPLGQPAQLRNVVG